MFLLTITALIYLSDVSNSSVLLDGVSQREFSYAHQEDWPESCFGNHQSPIDLPDVCYSDSIKIDTSLKLTTHGYGMVLPLSKTTITNNGHTIKVSVDGWDKVSSSAPTVTGTAANNHTYQFVSLHFHWNGDTTEGSEHAIHGSREASEMHMVHFNTKYSSKEEAALETDGILVLGTFFRQDIASNPNLNLIVSHLKNVHEVGSTTKPSMTFALSSLLPRDMSTFYQYSGSLTTPPCYESVTWILFLEFPPIGYAQLREFQKTSKFEDRERDIQALNGRTVYASGDAFCHMRRG